MSIKCMDDLKFETGSKEVFFAQRVTPFDCISLEFLQELSEKILSSNVAKSFPDLITFGFFCRKANLKQMQSKFSQINNRVGWGLTLHITPSNIPMNFAYSFLFGLLTGNVNVVRLSSNNYPQVELFCKLLLIIINKKKYELLSNRNAIVRFDKGSLFLKYNANLFDLRLVWGGDKTIKDMRSYNWDINCIEICFSDRFSLAVFDAESILKLNKDSMKKLCDNFYNDTFLVDQNACSSPKLIYWLGTKSKTRQARAYLWQYFSSVVDKQYKLSMVHRIDKQVRIIKILDSYNINFKVENFGNAVSTIWLDQLYSYTHELTSPFGLFFEFNENSLDELFKVVNRKYQTLIYFGVEPDLIKQKLISSGVKGIDRIVPAGQGLNIGSKWDGMDLLMNMTRYIDVG